MNTLLKIVGVSTSLCVVVLGWLLYTPLPEGTTDPGATQFMFGFLRMLALGVSLLSPLSFLILPLKTYVLVKHDFSRMLDFLSRENRLPRPVFFSFLKLCKKPNLF